MKLLMELHAFPCYSQKEILVSKIIFSWTFQRDDKCSRFRIIVPQFNQALKVFTPTYNFIDFLEPTKNWLKNDGDLNNNLFWADHLHLQNLEVKKLHNQFLHCYNSTKMYQRIQNLFLLVQLLAVGSF